MLLSKVTRGLFLLNLLALSSCTSVASTGASAIYNHQSLQKSTQDQYITLKSYQAIDIDDDRFKDANINVSTFNQVVVLTGQVTEQWQKDEAEKLIKKKVAGINEFYNLLTVERPTDQMTRLADTWITTKIKSKLFASNDLDSSQVKVITEKGTVVLVGVLRPQEAKAAVNAASHTDGVLKVVRVFTYLNASKTPIET